METSSMGWVKLNFDGSVVIMWLPLVLLSVTLTAMSYSLELRTLVTTLFQWLNVWLFVMALLMRSIEGIKLLSSFCGDLSSNHIYRETNFTADAVANLGHGLNHSKLWEWGLPLNCSVPFFFDLFGPACPRGFCL
ncbi:PREDICTED: PRUPE_1G162400 partial [Prunus dulcis]|uniref:PREDICTED: PRUPE_1G162400 partial n=1 Tax=Prunus dulcis TaxID=3755 RepID=A0A5E4FUX1_PRUDU|nr:PREDICTED: PRUPE_1G162400 partial [Prunus dulcis]